MVKGIAAFGRPLGRQGLSMVEALVALLVLMVISSAIVLLTLQLLALTSSSRLKDESVTYAEDIIEQVRNYYQANSWGALANYGLFNGSSVTNCYSSLWNSLNLSSDCVANCSNPSNAAKIAGTPFYRYFLVTTTPKVSVQISAVVVWQEHGTCRPKTQIDTYYYNY